MKNSHNVTSFPFEKVSLGSQGACAATNYIILAFSGANNSLATLLLSFASFVENNLLERSLELFGASSATLFFLILLIYPFSFFL